jgi:hypothetical protein
MSSFSINQMNQLAAKFEAVGWDSSRVTQFGQAPEGIFRKLEALLDGRAEVTVKSRLTASTTITLPVVKKPKRLKDRDDVWLSQNATNLFDSVEKLPAAEKRTLEHHDLVESLSDFDIIEEHDGENEIVFNSVGDLELAINQIVTKQAGNKPSKLLKDGKANIFYVRDPQNSSRVLSVRLLLPWGRGRRRWHVSSGEAHACRWDADNRVFSATAA